MKYPTKWTIDGDHARSSFIKKGKLCTMNVYIGFNSIITFGYKERQEIPCSKLTRDIFYKLFKDVEDVHEHIKLSNPRLFEEKIDLKYTEILSINETLRNNNQEKFTYGGLINKK